LPVCAVCLGRDCHLVISCKAARTWDGIFDTIAERINKALFTKDGHNICSRWQREEGCTDKHDSRHFCS
ncbi:hypothetical protein PAXRUDRAFT_39393, partial [Paxillus rubicundulus Ve08.2h10]